MNNNSIVQIPVEPLSKDIILEKIKKYIVFESQKYKKYGNFFHIVSINPENIVISTENKTFKDIVTTAQIKLVDGAGIVLAGTILNIPVGERVTGVGMMKELVKLAERMRLRVLLLGGKPNLAQNLSKCYQQKYKNARFFGIEAIHNIAKPLKSEEEEILSIVRTLRPHIIIAAFGSPEQEIWFMDHRDSLKGIVCIGVGGAFDYFGGVISRAPKIVQQLGFEWLFRLVVQPWRWRRQLRLIRFFYLVIKQRLI